MHSHHLFQPGRHPNAYRPARPNTEPTAVPTLSPNLFPEEKMLAELYNQVNPSIVNIRIVKMVTASNDLFSMPQYSNPQQMPPNQSLPKAYPQQGEGSGLVWDAQGHIVTNHHVIKDASTIEVTFANNTVLEAELVGSDPHSDIAVLQIAPLALTCTQCHLEIRMHGSRTIRLSMATRSVRW